MILKSFSNWPKANKNFWYFWNLYLKVIELYRVRSYSSIERDPANILYYVLRVPLCLQILYHFSLSSMQCDSVPYLVIVSLGPCTVLLFLRIGWGLTFQIFIISWNMYFDSCLLISNYWLGISLLSCRNI